MPDPISPVDHILILGGTAEARQLAEQLALRFPHCRLTMSLAGRTRSPRPQPIATRIGGFGGAAGLVRWIRDHRVSVLVIATHPFAAHMPMHALQAGKMTGIAVVRLLRPAWSATAGGEWIRCSSLVEAAQQLGKRPQRVFLPIGRQSVASFAAFPQHTYIVRSIEPLNGISLPHLHTLQARGPFSQRQEEALMTHWRITRMVCKNSGGQSMAAKLCAARALGIPVIMVERPALSIDVPVFDTAIALVQALPRYLTTP